MFICTDVYNTRKKDRKKKLKKKKEREKKEREKESLMNFLTSQCPQSLALFRVLLASPSAPCRISEPPQVHFSCLTSDSLWQTLQPQFIVPVGESRMSGTSWYAGEQRGPGGGLTGCQGCVPSRIWHSRRLTCLTCLTLVPALPAESVLQVGLS